MRKIFNLSLVLTLLFLSFIAYGCSEDSDPEQYSPKLYIYTPLKMGMTAKSEVVLSPSDIIMPDDIMEFYVYLSKEVSKDVIVSAVENPELAKKYSKEAVTLPQGSVEFIEKEVVIPAGTNVSAKPIRVRLKQNQAITEMEGKGMIALQITTASDVDVLADRSTFFWTVVKQKRNIFKGIIDGFMEYNASNLTLTANTHTTLLRRLYDNKENTQWYCENEGWVAVQLNNPIELKAVAIWPYGNVGSYAGSPKVIELQTSSDGTSWESLGAMEFPLPSTYSPLVLQLYSPMSTNYVRLIFLEGFSPTIRIAEIKIYQ